MKKLTYSTMLPLVLAAFLVFTVKRSEALESVKTLKQLPKKISVLLNPKAETENKGVPESKKEEELLEPVKLLGVEISALKEAVLTAMPVTALENPTVAQRFTVVLDPGHGGSDNSTAFQNVYEKDIVLAISKVTKDALEKAGIDVILTRDNDVSVPLRDRVRLKGDIFVSLHVNTTPKGAIETSRNGMEIIVGQKWVSRDSVLVRQSMDLASSFQANLSGLPIKMNDERRDISLYVLNNNTAPSILLELGYINNKNDFKLLTDKEYQEKLAVSFVSAIKDYRSKL